MYTSRNLLESEGTWLHCLAVRAFYAKQDSSLFCNHSYVTWWGACDIHCALSDGALSKSRSCAPLVHLRRNKQQVFITDTRFSRDGPRSKVLWTNRDYPYWDCSFPWTDEASALLGKPRTSQRFRSHSSAIAKRYKTPQPKPWLKEQLRQQRGHVSVDRLLHSLAWRHGRL